MKRVIICLRKRNILSSGRTHVDFGQEGYALYVKLAEYLGNTEQCMALAQKIDLWIVDETTGFKWFLTSERQSLWDRVASAVLTVMNRTVPQG